jgi:hypothetical protein
VNAVTLVGAVPRRIGGVLRHELLLLQSLLLALTRRRHAVPPDAVAIPYHRADQPMGIAMLVLSVAEVVVVELALPWATARRVLLVLGVYGAVLVAAMLADLAVRPHVVSADAVRLRLGSWAEVVIPLDEVAAVSRRLATAERLVGVAGSELVLASGSSTDVELRLVRELELGVGRRRGVVRTVRFSADRPDAAVAAIAAALAQRGSAPAGTEG